MRRGTRSQVSLRSGILTPFQPCDLRGMKMEDNFQQNELYICPGTCVIPRSSFCQPEIDFATNLLKKWTGAHETCMRQQTMPNDMPDV